MDPGGSPVLQPRKMTQNHYMSFKRPSSPAFLWTRSEVHRGPSRTQGLGVHAGGWGDDLISSSLCSQRDGRMTHLFWQEVTCVSYVCHVLDVPRVPWAPGAGQSTAVAACAPGWLVPSWASTHQMPRAGPVLTVVIAQNVARLGQLSPGAGPQSCPPPTIKDHCPD